MIRRKSIVGLLLNCVTLTMRSVEIALPPSNELVEEAIPKQTNQQHNDCSVVCHREPKIGTVKTHRLIALSSLEHSLVAEGRGHDK